MPVDNESQSPQPSEKEKGTRLQDQLGFLRLILSMARKLRGCVADRLVEVTTRTLQGRFLLRPDRRTNQIVTGVIARAQKRTGMKIVGPESMSNHMHLLLVPETTKQMSEFMRYVNSNVARKIGRLYGWTERFWSKRYSAIVVSDEEEAQVCRLKYHLSQGVKEGLVERPEDWPGLHVAPALRNGYSSITGGIWHDLTAQNRAQKAGASADVRPSDFIERGLEIKLDPLPCWKDLPWKARRDAARRLIEEIVEEARIERGERGVLGADAVQRQDPLSAPEKISRRYAPPCHAASRKARQELLREFREFSNAFIRAAEALRNGVPMRFPAGCFPPGLPYVPENPRPDG